VAQLLQGLMRVAREALQARGILVHVNNLENLSDADAARAGTIFRDLRDCCFRIRCASSIPAIVMDALRNDLKPIIGAQRRLIAR
jgi:hypothetical protein